MKKIWEWLLASHRTLHLVLGIPVGLFPTDWYNTEVLACGVAGGMECKDWQWGGKPDAIDFILTVAGVNIGYLLKLGFIDTL
jgi:hypothetical protein